MPGINVVIAVQDPGKTSSFSNSLAPKGVTQRQQQVIDASVNVSDAQYKAICRYIACIQNGDNTSSVETAVNAL